MNNNSLACKRIALQRETSRKAAQEPLLDYLRPVNSVFVLDTCYLIRLAKSGHGVYKSLIRLSEKGDVIVTNHVVQEFQRNAHSKRDVKKDDIAELYRAIKIGAVVKERVDVSGDKHRSLSERMAEKSEKNNRRLGAGDASIVMLTDILKGLYERITVLSEDSDVSTLIPATSGVMVKKAV